MVKRIVLTGGPCAGKTTILSKIEQDLCEKGYKVFVVRESATELISGGITPHDSGVGMKSFQKLILMYQYQKEEIYNKTLEYTGKILHLDGDKRYSEKTLKYYKENAESYISTSLHYDMSTNRNFFEKYLVLFFYSYNTRYIINIRMLIFNHEHLTTRLFFFSFLCLPLRYLFFLYELF